MLSGCHVLDEISYGGVPTVTGFCSVTNADFHLVMLMAELGFIGAHMVKRAVVPIDRLQLFLSIIMASGEHEDNNSVQLGFKGYQWEPGSWLRDFQKYRTAILGMIKAHGAHKVFAYQWLSCLLNLSRLLWQSVWFGYRFDIEIL